MDHYSFIRGGGWVIIVLYLEEGGERYDMVQYQLT